MMKHRTQRYIDVLQDVVYSYNHTIHRCLGKTPATITKDSKGESRLQQYLLRQPNIKSKKRSKKKERKSYKFKIGQNRSNSASVPCEERVRQRVLSKMDW